MKTFEEELAETPFREIPRQWEARMLPPPRRSSLAFVWEILTWPPPLAWGTVAACWLGIFLLNFSGPRGADLYVGGTGKPVMPKGNLLDSDSLWQYQRRYVLLAPDSRKSHHFIDPRSL